LTRTAQCCAPCSTARYCILSAAPIVRLICGYRHSGRPGRPKLGERGGGHGGSVDVGGTSRWSVNHFHASSLPLFTLPFVHASTDGYSVVPAMLSRVPVKTLSHASHRPAQQGALSKGRVLNRTREHVAVVRSQIPCVFVSSPHQALLPPPEDSNDHDQAGAAFRDHSRGPALWSGGESSVPGPRQVPWTAGAATAAV
jgi:hypothetical protein